MRLIIDGDGSPVKDTTIAVAKKYGLPVVIVTSIDHYSKKNIQISWSLFMWIVVPIPPILK